MPQVELSYWIENGVQPSETHEFAPLKRQPGVHYVYLASDARGRLLYVGIAEDVYRRLGQHAAASEWYDAMEHLTVEVHRSKEQAANREALLISVHAPPHNRQLRAGYNSANRRRMAAIARVQRLKDEAV